MFIFKVTGVKIRTILAIFDPFLPFPDNNSTGNCHMTMKRDIQLLGDMNRCPIYFEGHMWKFKVTRAQNLVIFDPFLSFPDNNIRFGRCISATTGPIHSKSSLLQSSWSVDVQRNGRSSTGAPLRVVKQAPHLADAVSQQPLGRFTPNQVCCDRLGLWMCNVVVAHPLVLHYEYYNTFYWHMAISNDIYHIYVLQTGDLIPFLTSSPGIYPIYEPGTNRWPYSFFNILPWNLPDLRTGRCRSY